MSNTVQVAGMSCGGCEQNVEDALEALDGVSRADADHRSDSVELVTDGVTDDDIRVAVEDAGYQLAD